MNKFITTAAILLVTTTVFAQSDRVQCIETTKKNTQCKNLAVIGRNLCWQHDSTYVKPVNIEAIQCNGITKSNTQCKNKTRHVSGKCHHHR
tara:strand:- start:528 stop:800 length:273 start_codon:yes stop_codon:yes gene_type:complete